MTEAAPLSLELICIPWVKLGCEKAMIVPVHCLVMAAMREFSVQPNEAESATQVSAQINGVESHSLARVVD